MINTSRGQGKVLNTRKGNTMKNAITRVDALNFAIDELTSGGQIDAEYVEVVEILTKIRDGIANRKTSDTAKANAKAKRADARAALMAQVLPVLRDALTDGGTAKEIFERCADALPEDFTSAKVQYILLHELADEVVKTEQKGKPNVYTLR